MSPTVIIIIIVAAFIGIFFLRRSLRSSIAASIPTVTYVDETLLDLVRTKQMQAAADHYQKHALSTPEEAQKTIEYFVVRPESLMLLVRLQDDGQAPLFVDDTLTDYLAKGRVMKAIQYYANQTGADLREAQVAVDAIAVNPQMNFKRRVD